MTFWGHAENRQIRDICREVMDRDTVVGVSEETVGKDYGTNNSHAYDAGECTQSFNGRHHFTMGRQLGICYVLDVCEFCGARHKVDSSD